MAGKSKLDNERYKQFGLKKENQDAYIASTSTMGLPHCHFFGVLDGHGLNGRPVIKLLEKRLPINMTDKLRDKILFAEEGYDLDKQYPEPSYVREGIKNAFAEMSEELSMMIEDTRCSGSTFSGVLIFGNMLFPINLGDSRSLLIMKRGLDRQIKFAT